ncbi:hypothetical protein [Streptomyces sp. NRRL S-87]|uniref:hypothetical protein n=1 Tax=Streptomyces sp. NRRL S-87 TaxID=1463920 RepID=UPI0004BEBB99|nr:hypothetical protein [Streptomyces sp. NRRL S-87]
MADRARIIVHPVGPIGGRAVIAHVHGTDAALGTAYDLADVAEFMRRIGLEDAEDLLAARDPLIEWQGGGPDVWGESPP